VFAAAAKIKADSWLAFAAFTGSEAARNDRFLEGRIFRRAKSAAPPKTQSLPWGDRMVAMLRLAGALLIVTFTWPACALAEDVQVIAQAVDEHYNHVRTLQAEFTEVYRGSGVERTESGTVWLAKGGLKKPGKMRWEYRSPKEKLFVSDGKDAWFYVPDERQARKSAARKLDDIRSPLAFLLGKTKLQKELQGLSLAPDVAPLAAGNLVLRGVPEAMADRVSEILLEVTPEHQIVRIVIAEVDGSTTEYRFSNQKEDVAIPDARFQFHPPPGTETVEGELGG
jgi:outer membrane lipoprotein carrier protein